MDQEQIVLEVDSEPAVRAMKEANKGLEGVEGKAKTVIDKMGRQWTVYGDVVVRVADRSKASVDRLIASMDRQAQMYGKSGVERLIAQRDQLLRRYDGEKKAIDAITSAYDKMITKEREAASGGHGGFSSRAAIFGIKDMAEGRGMYAGVEAFNVVRSMGGIGAIIGGATLAFTGLALAGRSAASSLGEFALETENVHLRTGLAVKEVEAFSFAAKAAGSDVNVYERMMRGLSQAAEDTSVKGAKARSELKMLGVDLRDAAGDLKPTSEVLLELADGLNKLPAGIQRDAASMEIFKRVGIDAIPVLEGLREHVNWANQHGLGVTDTELSKWRSYKERMEEAQEQWEQLKRAVKEPLAATFVFTMKTIGDFTKNIQKWNSESMMNIDGSPVLGEYNPGGSSKPALSAAAAPPGPDPRRVALRQSLDRKITALLNSGDGTPEGRLRAAEKALAMVPVPQIGISSQSDIDAYTKALNAVNSAKAAIKANTQAKEGLNQFNAWNLTVLGHEDPLMKPFMIRDEIVAKNPALAGQATFTAAMASQQEFKKYHDSVIARGGLWIGETDNQLSNSPEALAVRLQMEREQAAKDKLNTENAEGITKQLGIDPMLRRIRVANLGTQAGLGELGAYGGHAERMIGLNSTASGPEGELQVLRQQLDVRKQIREQELQVKQAHKDLFDMDKERYDAEAANLQDRFTWEEKIAEINRKRYDDIKGTASGLAHTLFTSPSQFGGQFRSTVKEAALKPLDNMVGGLVASLITPLFGGGNTEQTRNTNALYTLTGAVYNLAGVMSGGTVGGGGGWTVTGGGGPSSSGGDYSGMTVGGGGGGDASGVAGIAGLGGMIGAGGGGGSAMGGIGGVAGTMMKAGLSGKGMVGNFKGALTNLRNFVGVKDGFGSMAMGAKLNSIGRSPAMGMAGTMLATNGLMGYHAGTAGGMLEGAAGGAMIGFEMGGPMGAAIGAGVGFSIGLGEMLAGYEDPVRKAQRMAKQIYGVTIDQNTAKQIASLAKQTYGGNVAEAVRSQEGRQMIMMYSEATGQKMPLSAMAPHGAGLVETGGKLFQQASFVNGTPYTYQSSLPVSGGYGGNMYPSTVSLNINGQSAADLLEGRIANTVTPSYVQDAWASAGSSSNGRVSNSAMIQAPGLITS